MCGFASVGGVRLHLAAELGQRFTRENDRSGGRAASFDCAVAFATFIAVTATTVIAVTTTTVTATTVARLPLFALGTLIPSATLAGLCFRLRFKGLHRMFAETLG